MKQTESHDELSALGNEFRKEIQWVFGASRSPLDLDPLRRRLLVRSVYALAEGIAYLLKQDALVFGGDTLGADEQAICSEQTFELSSSGEIESRPMRLRTLNNLRFAFEVSASVHGSSYVLDVRGAGWASFRAGLGVRDRLAHPKRLADLDISDAEINAVASAFDWFDRSLEGLLEANAKALLERADQIKAAPKGANRRE